jgi:hypothetical protein
MMFGSSFQISMFGFYIISILPLLAYELYYDRTFLSCIIGLMVSFLVCVLKIFAPWHEVRRRDER